MLRVSPIRAAAFALALTAPAAAHASFLHGDTLDAAANVLAWFILIAMPIVGIGLFLFVHVLPEKIAEKRHHPQKDSIKVLCILSLFFGGLLWPLAWLWAYTRPVMSKAVYGTEKHDDYYIEMGEKARTGALTADELEDLRHELAGMAARGTLAPKLRRLHEDLAAIEQQAAAAPRKEREKA